LRLFVGTKVAEVVTKKKEKTNANKCRYVYSRLTSLFPKCHLFCKCKCEMMAYKTVSRAQVFHDGFQRSKVTGEIKYLLTKLHSYALFCQVITLRPFLCSYNRFHTFLTNGTAKSRDAPSQNNKFTQARRCFALKAQHVMYIFPPNVTLGKGI